MDGRRRIQVAVEVGLLKKMKRDARPGACRHGKQTLLGDHVEQVLDGFCGCEERLGKFFREFKYRFGSAAERWAKGVRRSVTVFVWIEILDKLELFASELEIPRDMLIDMVLRDAHFKSENEERGFDEE